MSDKPPRREDGKDRPPDGSTGPRRRPPRWGMALLIGSVILMAAAVAVPMVLGSGSPAAPQTTGGTLVSGGAGLVGGSAPAEGGAPEGEGSLWSPAVFRLGFGFFVGFAVAYALRSFFKLAIICAGFFFLALMGLQYAGIIDVRWGVVEQRYDSVSQWLTGQFDSAKAFATGYLPAMGTAAAGFAAGFLRRP